MDKLTSDNREILTTPHRTNFYHVFLFENSSPDHSVDFHQVKTEPFSILFIDKSRVHKFDGQKDYQGKLIVFTDDFFCKSDEDTRYLTDSVLFNDLHDNCLLRIQPEIFSALSDILTQIENEFNHFDEKTSPVIQKNLFHNFLLITEREKNKLTKISTFRSDDLKYCREFKNLLNKYFKENKTVGFYAEMISVSEKRLGRATAEIFGNSPKEIIKGRILQEAKRLLVYSQLSVKQIAYELGFDEPTNFIKYFKKQTSVTPQSFKQTYLNS